MSSEIDGTMISRLKTLNSAVHPSALVLHKAAQIAETIQQLLDELEVGSALHNQVLMHERSLSKAIHYLEATHHKIVFIGSIGVGKTTAICHLLGLVIGDKPLLSTGAGRTTVCEVVVSGGKEIMISEGKENTIHIEPLSEEEVKNYLEDFADSILTSGSSRTDQEETFKLSAEIERSLRNMMGLPIERKKDENGKRITIDHAKLRANEIGEKSALVADFMARINLPARTKTQLTHPQNDELPPFEWLQKHFAEINNGRNPDVPLPRKIIISIKRSLFGDHSLQISIVDTKGVDQTANREDLEQQILDKRALLVLCSRFPDAPDKATVELLRNVIDAGLGNRISEEITLLVLDRNDEAKQVNDFDGPANDITDGREIRQDQIRNDLVQTLKLERIQIDFFNALQDAPLDLRARMFERLAAMRRGYEQHIDGIAGALDDIIHRRQDILAELAFRHVSNTIRTWLRQNNSLRITVSRIYAPLIDTISSREVYAASVRASVNRLGYWQNLDYYYEISFSARCLAGKPFQEPLRDFKALINNLEQQSDLHYSRQFLRQLRSHIETRMEEIHDAIAEIGRRVYEEVLKIDNKFWLTVQNEWGRGPGYKQRIANDTQTWFTEEQSKQKEELVTQHLQKHWTLLLTDIEKMLEKP